MDIRNSNYDSGLRRLRYMLLFEGIALSVLSVMFGKINEFIYVFVILTSIFLFCEINIKNTYQFLIVIALFSLIKQAINLLMFIFYRAEEDKQMNPAKAIVMYGLSILVILKLIFVTWRHYQNKVLQHIISGTDQEFGNQF